MVWLWLPEHIDLFSDRITTASWFWRLNLCYARRSFTYGNQCARGVEVVVQTRDATKGLKQLHPDDCFKLQALSGDMDLLRLQHAGDVLGFDLGYRYISCLHRSLPHPLEGSEIFDILNLVRFTTPSEVPYSVWACLQGIPINPSLIPFHGKNLPRT